MRRITTQAQELSFQEAFNSFDYDNDGQIRVEEFATAIRATGLPVKIADIREMEDQIRFNYNGYVTMGLFKEFYGKMNKKYGMNQTWHFNNAVKKLDWMNAKKIPMAKLRQLMSKGDTETISEANLNKFFGIANIDPKAEFVDMDAFLAGLEKKQMLGVAGGC